MYYRGVGRSLYERVFGEATEGPFFHGTSDVLGLQPGHKLQPPSETGKIQERGRKKALDRVFLTADPGSARIYAGRAAAVFGGKPVVYRVKPSDDLIAHHTRPGTSVYSASSAHIIDVHAPKGKRRIRG